MTRTAVPTMNRRIRYVDARLANRLPDNTHIENDLSPFPGGPRHLNPPGSECGDKVPKSIEPRSDRMVSPTPLYPQRHGLDQRLATRPLR